MKKLLATAALGVTLVVLAAPLTATIAEAYTCTLKLTNFGTRTATFSKGAVSIAGGKYWARARGSSVRIGAPGGRSNTLKANRRVTGGATGTHNCSISRVKDAIS